jgi:hypothetical protein
MSFKKGIFLILPVVLLSFCILSISTAQEDTTKGKLGYPLGTRLIIKGIRYAAMKKKGFIPTDRGNRMLVDTINGIKLDKPISIGIEVLRKTGDFHTVDFRYTLSGYESGKWIGLDSISQAIPQFYRYFKVDSILYPTTLDYRKIDSTGHK